MEKRDLVDQKAAGRLERVRAQVLAHPALFAAQGCVVATWRTHRGRRLGPYFRVSYRESGRQRSIYLGQCGELVRRVRELLARRQGPRRQRRLFARLKAQARSALRRSKIRLKEELARWGIRMKGFELRGAARVLRIGRRVTSGCPATVSPHPGPPPPRALPCRATADPRQVRGEGEANESKSSATRAETE